MLSIIHLRCAANSSLFSCENCEDFDSFFQFLKHQLMNHTVDTKIKHPRYSIRMYWTNFCQPTVRVKQNIFEENQIEHSDPKIAMNFKSLYLEEFSFYWFETLLELFYYAELDFWKFSINFIVHSLKYLIGKNWNLARSEGLTKVVSLNLYASFGTFCVRIGQFFESQWAFEECRNIDKSLFSGFFRMIHDSLRL